jgi:hypothetical protein
MPKQISARQQFDKMGIDPADYTKPMQIAIKQRWTLLPVECKVGDLRNMLAAVTPAPTPSAVELAAENLARDGIEDRDGAEREAKRLAANARVNAWRERGRIQAALDARDLKYAALRAKKVKTVTVSGVVDDGSGNLVPTGDVQVPADLVADDAAAYSIGTAS